jgi:prepilin-type N-terminal cleavage/methylation domain-containing protein/prepilin-type processing-associated H-X9-DG protein
MQSFNTLRTRSIAIPSAPRETSSGKSENPKPRRDSGKNAKPATRPGFTLVETLVCVAIVASLGTIATVGARKAIASAKTANEIQAGRQLIIAYLGNASENQGALMAGIDPEATATDSLGNVWPGYVAKRYPARLAESLGYQFRGSVCVNESEKWADDFYSATVYPAFGMNSTFVGGSYRETEPDPERDAERFGNFCIRRLSQEDSPGRQMVFVSARSHSGHGTAKAGNFYVRSPYLKGRRWDQDFDEKRPSLRWGNVDPRHSGQAVAAFLDGSVRLLGKPQLQDMRIWAKGAREADDPAWSMRR